LWDTTLGKMAENRALTILAVDDDEDDLLFVSRALEKSELPSKLYTVRNADAMMDFLRQSGEYMPRTAPAPDLILLDLNMPGKNGKDALIEVRRDAALKHIPVILFSTSGSEQDILDCYRLGANSYIQKPASFDAIVEVMDVLKKYWMEHAALPPKQPTS
jgi:CheY-like chemotaxis protein